MRWIVLGILAAGLGWSGCSPDFDEEWQVTDLRVLAMRTEPPEIQLPSNFSEVPPMSMRALVVDPRGSDDTEYDWELWLCTAEEDSCADAPADERELLVATRTVLGDIAHTFTLTRARYEQALERDLFDGLGGVAIMLELRIADSLAADDTDSSVAQVRAIKRVVFAEQTKTIGDPNTNPNLAVTLGGEPLGDVSTVPPATPIVILPDAAASQETYQRPTLSGGADLVPSDDIEEAMTYFFFASDGELSEARTGGKDSPFVDFQTTEDLTSVWTTPTTPGDVTLWIVVREERGGVQWMTRTVRVE